MKTIYKITFFLRLCRHRWNSFCEGLSEYISDWEHLVSWSSEDIDEEEYEECGEECGEACFYDSQEYEDYVENCGYNVAKATEDDFENWGIDSEEIQEI